MNYAVLLSLALTLPLIYVPALQPLFDTVALGWSNGRDPAAGGVTCRRARAWTKWAIRRVSPPELVWPEAFTRRSKPVVHRRRSRPGPPGCSPLARFGLPRPGFDPVRDFQRSEMDQAACVRSESIARPARVARVRPEGGAGRLGRPTREMSARPTALPHAITAPRRSATLSGASCLRPRSDAVGACRPVYADHRGI